MIFPSGQIIYKIYEDGNELPGVVKITNPNIKYKTAPTNGAGILGDVDIPLCGAIDAMSMTMDFSSHDALVQLGSNKWHDVQIMESSQHFDAVTRTEELRAIRFEASIRPTDLTMGDVQSYTQRNAKATFAMCKYAVYVDDVEKIYIDQFDVIHRIDGVDYAADMRKAIGMT